MFSRTSLATATAAVALIGLTFAKDDAATTTVDLIQWMGSDGEMVGSVVTAVCSTIILMQRFHLLSPRGHPDVEGGRPV